MTTVAADRPIPFVSMPVDLMLMGGLSIVHLIIVMSLKWTGLYSFGSTGMVIAGMLVWGINHPHFSATCHRLYSSKENIRQFPVTSIIVPILLVGLMVVCLAMPQTVAPWMIKFFLIWSPYHFCAQSLGITLVYARRAGIVIPELTRWFLSCFIFLTFITGALRGESVTRPFYYYYTSVPKFGLPSWMTTVSFTMLCMTGIIALFLVLRDCKLQDKKLPLLLLVPPVAQLGWFIIGSGVRGYTEFVPAYHSLQYLVIAWAIHLKMRMDSGAQAPSKRFVLRESAIWGVINFIFGAVLFFTFPWLAHKITGLSLGLATGIVIAVVQIHHFFVDGVIWKLRSPNVAQPLMVHIDDLTGRVACK